MLLSATLPLAIGLNFFWFAMALLLYRRSVILGLSFLDPKHLCLPHQFSKPFCQYIFNLMSRFNDWINAYFQSFLCLSPYHMNIFWSASLSKFPWRFWTEFSQSWNNLRKTLRSHENLWSLTDLSGGNIGIHSNSRDWLFWMFMMSKIKERCVNSIFYLHKK